MKVLMSAVTALALASGLLVATVADRSARPVEAASCREVTIYPARYGYTFDQRGGNGRIPGHAFVAFYQPLPAGWRVVGSGSATHWKDEGNLSYFLVNGWPWTYRLVYTSCSGPQPGPAPSPR